MKNILQVVAALAVLALAGFFLMPTFVICGSATVQVRTNTEIQSIEVGLDSLRLFGKQIDSVDLIKIIEHRIKAKKGSPRTEEWRTNPYSKECYKIDRAVEILIKIKHPEIRKLCIALLRDPYFSHRAVGYLAAIGGTESSNAILYAWLDDQNYPGIYINACQTLKDPRAIPLLINAIGPQYQHTKDNLKVIEEISGESLAPYVDVSAHFQSSTDVLKMKLWIWWVEYKNRNHIKSI